MDEVRAVSIEISNIRGLPKAEIRFGKPEAGKGQLIVLIGDNGSGKSSGLDGIQALFSGGHQPKLIRDGAEKAEVHMVLSDGTDIKRVITKKGYRLSITTADGAEVKAPESYVKKLASGFGFDPISFVTAKREDRLKYLLNVMPLEFGSQELFAAAATAMKQFGMITGGLPAAQDITGLNRLIKELTEKRGAIGSRRDDRASAAESFRKTLLASDQAASPKDWKAELARLEKQRDGIQGTETAEVREIEGQFQQVSKQLESRIRSVGDVVQAEFSRLLQLARAGADQMIQIVTGAESTQALGQGLCDLANGQRNLSMAANEAQAAIDKVRSENAESLKHLWAEIATAKAGAEEQIRSGAIRGEMERCQKDAKALSEDWDTVAKAIKNLEELRRSKLKELPVEGLEVGDDGEIYMHGRQFDQWNTGAKYMHAMQIGAVGAGDLGLLIADDTAHLGPDLWREFQEAVVESGLTVIAARLASAEEIDQYGPGLRSQPALALVV